jgi:hypothetical protein
MPQPLPYHLKVCEHFKAQKKTWDFFASSQTREEQLNGFKLELLKNSYKFDRVADSKLYEKVELAKTKLGLDQLTVHLYQQEFANEINASIVYLDREAHIVFSGRVTGLLDDEEVLAVLGHELTHIKLYNLMEGDLEIADRIITAIANNYNSEPAYYETARLFRLYSEIFCDRGAYTVVGNTAPVITTLVKIATGLEKVSAESYVRQAEEIFNAEKRLRSATISHPENFIRARAIHLWHNNKEEAEDEIVKMIEGISSLDQLDILKQKELSALTKEYLQLFLKPKWFQTVLVLSQAKRFFSDFRIEENIFLKDQIKDKIANLDISLKEYLAFILLDFVLVDPALELVPFGWAFQFGEDVGIKETFDDVVKREFKYSDKKLQQHKQGSLEAYHEVKEGAMEQIYEE